MLPLKPLRSKASRKQTIAAHALADDAEAVAAMTATARLMSKSTAMSPPMNKLSLPSVPPIETATIETLAMTAPLAMIATNGMIVRPATTVMIEMTATETIAHPATIATAMTVRRMTEMTAATAQVVTVPPETTATTVSETTVRAVDVGAMTATAGRSRRSLTC